MLRIAFPSPDHDHSDCTRQLLARADLVCAQAGARLTPLRHQVLKTVAQTHRAIGAYEIIGRMAKSGPAPAPISVYRALDFLQAQGLVHKVESRNAYVACNHGGHSADAILLICEDCGMVGEIAADSALSGLESRAREHGFAAKALTVEISGQCRTCCAADG